LSFEIMNTTGLGLLTETALQVSPNPFTSCFNVNAPSNAQLILLDSRGIIVYSASSNENNKYCPSHLLAGTYILLIQSDNSIKRIRVVKLYLGALLDRKLAARIVRMGIVISTKIRNCPIVEKI